MKKFDPYHIHFLNAIKDYRYLLDHHYPQRSCLKLVGDRYKLISDARTILYRGIASKQDAEIREKKLTDQIQNKPLIIDAYNVLFILMNYLEGKYVFISSDNYCRDAGSQFGRIRQNKLFETLLGELYHYIKVQYPTQVQIFFDAPVLHSANHKTISDMLFHNLSLQGTSHVVRSADQEIKKISNGIIATSDTAIIDAMDSSFIDLPRKFLEDKYGLLKLNLKSLIEEIH